MLAVGRARGSTLGRRRPRLERRPSLTDAAIRAPRAARAGPPTPIERGGGGGGRAGGPVTRATGVQHYAEPL